MAFVLTKYTHDDADPDAQRVWFVLNRFLDVFFSIDIFVNFLTAYRDEQEAGAYTRPLLSST